MDLESNEKYTIPNEGLYFYHLAYLSTNSIAVGNISGSVHVYQNSGEGYQKTGKIEGRIIHIEHCKAVRCILFEESLNRIISASDDLHINTYDVESLKVQWPLVGHQDIITGLDYSPKMNLLASCSQDGTVKLWDLRSNKAEVQTLKLPEEDTCWDLSFSANGEEIVVGSDSICYVLTK